MKMNHFQEKQKAFCQFLIETVTRKLRISDNKNTIKKNF